MIIKLLNNFYINEFSFFIQKKTFRLKIMNNNNQNMSDGPTNFRNVRSKSISQFQFDNKTDTLNVRRTLSAPTLSVPPTPPPQPTSIVSIPTTVINQISGIIQPNNVDIFEKMLTKFL